MGRSVLIVEDVDQKYEDVCAIVLSSGDDLSVTRARTVVEAQDAIAGQDWDIVVVDISMDIVSTKDSRHREAHANLGGMDLIEQMYLMGRDVPTVIVTGFDYFVRIDRDATTQEAQTFSDLEHQARQWLGEKLFGCVRYGVPQWDSELRKCMEGILQ
jgi:CheY-like chemotaxis protein